MNINVSKGRRSLYILIFALLLSYTGMPEDSIRYIAYITEAVGAFLAGIVPAKKIRRKPIIL